MHRNRSSDSCLQPPSGPLLHSLNFNACNAHTSTKLRVLTYLCSRAGTHLYGKSAAGRLLDLPVHAPVECCTARCAFLPPNACRTILIYNVVYFPACMSMQGTIKGAWKSLPHSTSGLRTAPCKHCPRCRRCRRCRAAAGSWQNPPAAPSCLRFARCTRHAPESCGSRAPKTVRANCAPQI